jgi:hypothetical protein
LSQSRAEEEGPPAVIEIRWSGSGITKMWILAAFQWGCKVLYIREGKKYI